MRIICPACGVNMTVPDDHPGGVVLCGNCGKRIRIREPAPPRGEDDIDFQFDPSSARVIPRNQLAAKKSRVPMTLVAVVSAAMLAMLFFAVRHAAEPAALPLATPVITPVVPWDRSHRSDLLAMKSTADLLAREGSWQASYDSYQRILTFVGDHAVTDPVAITVVESVRPGQERAMAALTAIAAAPAPTSQPNQMPVMSVTQPSSTAFAEATMTQATTQPTSQPITVLDPAQVAADTAPPLPGSPPTLSPLHAYTLPDAVSDAQIGDAINRGVAYLKSQFVNGEVESGLGGARQRNNRGRPRGGGPGGGPGGDPPGGGGAPPPRSNLENGSNLENLPMPPGIPPIGPGGPGGGAGGGPGGGLLNDPSGAYSNTGVDTLCVYALLNAGRAMDVPGLAENDPFTEQILETLKAYKLTFTYHRSLRAAALAVFNRTQDNAVLEEDVQWLTRASVGGAYSYTMPVTRDNAGWDNSNSQYGLLGVWSGAQAGKSVSQNYWLDVERHWNSCALGNGTWGYSFGGGATTTMTCAAVASLLVAGDYINSAGSVGGIADRPSPSRILDAGLAWLDSGDNCISNLEGDGMGGPGYGLYGLERVGLASGFKYFGNHDWYAELARRLVAEQHLDGSWGRPGSDKSQNLIDTSYALLFLSRGRHPILFNKLRYDGPWNNRPHDAAHLARFASHQLERPLNWQVVNLRRNWFDWMDCPVLYISGDKQLKLTNADYTALRDFADGGGLIFTHADGGSPEFTRWVQQLVRKIFPRYELMLVPRDHAVYSTVYKVKNPPPLLSVSNGSRLLLIHSPTDLAGGWQVNWTDEKKDAFQMGINLFVYAAGKGNLKNRLASPYIPPYPDRADLHGQFAVLQYAGEWNPEPYAWTRFSRYFQWETRQQLEPVVVQMKELSPGLQPMAVLTGTVRHDFTDAENSAARAYVQAGGVLMIDACGGQTAFVKSVEQTLLANAFAGATPRPIAANHPLLIASRAHADFLSVPLLRSYAKENGGKDLPVEAIAFGKGWVIFSRLDITTGLLGTQSWGVMGFEPVYAEALMKNAVLWAEARSVAR